MVRNGNKTITLPISLDLCSESPMSYMVTEVFDLLFIIKAALVMASKLLPKLGKILKCCS